jgi:hypothetical protein
MDHPAYIRNSLLSLFLLCSNLITLQAQDVRAFENDTATAGMYLRERGEVYFSFTATPSQVQRLGLIISIDNYRDGTAWAYACSSGFKAFLEESIEFTVYSPPGEWYRDQPSVKGSWDYYPSYSEYVDMMKGWANEYAHLCELFDAGDSTEGRNILFLRITGDSPSDHPRPLFMYSSTMHGDETTGFVLMLRLVEYLLENYPDDAQVARLLDNLEIWINPLANPDGTYFGGDGNQVTSPKRFNANNSDLNRDFPRAGESEPAAGERQAETSAMMDLMGSRQFVLSANIHDGAEVMNYPWDFRNERHADDVWFEYICREYADTAHKYSPPDYMTFLGGVTNGFDWYPIAGGRQDYVTWYRRGREVTMEINEIKHPPPSMLPDLWEYNRRSLLHYMEQAMFGIRGRVTDLITGDPVMAKVEIQDHDNNYSYVYTEPSGGWFFRLIQQGFHELLVSADGYISDTVSVQVRNRQAETIDISLVPGYTLLPGPENPENTGLAVYFSPGREEIVVTVNIALPSVVSISLYDTSGRKIRALYGGMVREGHTRLSFSTRGLRPGVYIAVADCGRYAVSRKILIPG